MKLPSKKAEFEKNKFKAEYEAHRHIRPANNQAKWSDAPKPKPKPVTKEEEEYNFPVYTLDAEGNMIPLEEPKEKPKPASKSPWMTNEELAAFEESRKNNVKEAHFDIFCLFELRDVMKQLLDYSLGRSEVPVGVEVVQKEPVFYRREAIADNDTLVLSVFLHECLVTSLLTSIPCLYVCVEYDNCMSFTDKDMFYILCQGVHVLVTKETRANLYLEFLQFFEMGEVPSVMPAPITTGIDGRFSFCFLSLRAIVIRC